MTSIVTDSSPRRSVLFTKLVKKSETWRAEKQLVGKEVEWNRENGASSLKIDPPVPMKKWDTVKSGEKKILFNAESVCVK